MPIYNKHNISDDLIRFGDLIIKFNVRFPKVDEITDRQYQLLNRALNSSRFSLKNNLSSSSEDNSMSGYSTGRSSALAMNSGSTSTTSVDNIMAGNSSKGSKMSTGSSGNESNSSSVGKNNSRRVDSSSTGSDKSSKRQKMVNDGDLSVEGSKSKSVKMKSDPSLMDGNETTTCGAGISSNVDPSTVSTSGLASFENSAISTGASSVPDLSVDVNKIVDKEKRKAALEAADIEADRKEVELLNKVDKALADDEIDEADTADFAENNDADDEQREPTPSIKKNDQTDVSLGDHESLYVSDINSNSKTYKEKVSNNSSSSHTDSNDNSDYDSDSDQKNTYASSDSGSDNEKIAYLSDYLEDDYNNDDDDDDDDGNTGENDGDDPNGRSRGNSMFENFR
ncbi:unnamed protein product [[Candida] boidinii]|nr:unnamed protein product [[Candida] boidinii]